jgi:DNA (cytosine-5)-methyltransferase 1
MHPLTHASLFSGIGGFDLAAAWMGWENILQCEIEPFPRKILKHYWPHAILYEDITKTDFTPHRGTIDVLTGGFPWQPYSLAGKRKGKADHRHLWPEMLRAIRELQPRYIVGENVPGIINWNNGLVFEEIQAQMDAEGYQTIPVILPADALFAPHLRDRVWFIGYAQQNGYTGGCEEARGTYSSSEKRGMCEPSGADSLQSNNAAHASSERYERGRFNENRSAAGESQTERQKRQWFRANIGGAEQQGPAAHTPAARSQKPQTCEQRESLHDAERNHIPNAGHNTRERMEGNGAGRQQKPQTSFKKGLSGCHYVPNVPAVPDWENFPTQPPLCSGNDGLPAGMDGITFSKWRNESLKGYGNAIVPQVALQIFKAIEKFELLITNNP